MQALSFPPGPPRRFLTPSLVLKRNALSFLQNLTRQYGDIVQFQMGELTIVLLNDPELIRDVMVTHAQKFEKRVASKQLREFLGDSMLMNPGGESHRRQRRLVQPAFHRSRLTGYAALMAELAEQTSGGWRNGDVRTITEDMARLTLHVVIRTLFSSDVATDTKIICEAVSTLVRYDRWRFPGASWLLRQPFFFGAGLRAARETMDRTTYRLIHERRATGRDTGDLLSMLLLAEDADRPGESLSDDEVRDQAMTLILAGHETTAHALSWFWWLLAAHSDVAAKLYEELTRVLAGRTPTLADLPRLTYTESCIREALRVYPSVWAVSRVAVAEHELGGFRIAPRTQILLSQWVIQRDARYFSSPETFMPERWTPEFRDALPKFAYFPFGGGSRTCIGEGFAWMEMTLVVATIAQHWRFHPTSAIPPQPKLGITLRPGGKLRLRIERR